MTNQNQTQDTQNQQDSSLIVTENNRFVQLRQRLTPTTQQKDAVKHAAAEVIKTTTAIVVSAIILELVKKGTDAAIEEVRDRIAKDEECHISNICIEGECYIVEPEELTNTD